MPINPIQEYKQMIDRSVLNHIDIFTPLTPETRQAIARRAFQREVPAGVSLIIEGMPAEFCYFLLSGEVRVLRMNTAGKVQVLGRFSPPAPLNVISLLKDDRINQASIETLTQTKLLVLGAEDFNWLLSHQPDFSALLLRIFAERMAEMAELAAGLSLYTVRARLARFLIELAGREPAAGGWTQDEIAGHIGTVRDVVGRLLREFESEGLIERHQQEIILLDKQGLHVKADINEI